MLKTISISKLVSKLNVRDEHDGNLNELAESIKANGLISPLGVRELSNGKYEIIAGHRRYQALKMIGETFVECNVLEDVMDTEDMLRIQLAENVQRKNMSAYEYVKCFDMLKEKYDISNAKLALYLNKSVSWVNDQYLAVKFLNDKFGGEDKIPEEYQKKSASTIKAMKRHRHTTTSKTAEGNGFTVTVKKHSYIVYCNDFEFENKLNEFLKQNGISL